MIRATTLLALFSSSNKQMKAVRWATRAKFSRLCLDYVKRLLLPPLVKIYNSSTRECLQLHQPRCLTASLACSLPIAKWRALQSWRRTAAAITCQILARAHRWSCHRSSSWIRHWQTAWVNSNRWRQCQSSSRLSPSLYPVKTHKRLTINRQIHS